MKPTSKPIESSYVRAILDSYEKIIYQVNLYYCIYILFIFTLDV